MEEVKVDLFPGVEYRERKQVSNVNFSKMSLWSIVLHILKLGSEIQNWFCIFLLLRVTCEMVRGHAKTSSYLMDNFVCDYQGSGDFHHRRGRRECYLQQIACDEGVLSVVC